MISTKKAHSKTTHGSLEMTRLSTGKFTEEPQTQADSHDVSIFGITEVPQKKIITESFIDDMILKR